MLFHYRGPTLEEIARIFDGEDAVAHIDMAQVEKEIRTGEVGHTEVYQDEKR